MSNPKNDEFLKQFEQPKPAPQVKEGFENGKGEEYDNPRWLNPREPDPTATDWA